MKTELHTRDESMFLTLTPESFADKNDLEHRLNQALSLRVKAVKWFGLEGPFGYSLTFRVSTWAKGEER